MREARFVEPAERGTVRLGDGLGFVLAVDMGHESLAVVLLGPDGSYRFRTTFQTDALRFDSRFRDSLRQAATDAFHHASGEDPQAPIHLLGAAASFSFAGSQLGAALQEQELSIAVTRALSQALDLQVERCMALGRPQAEALAGAFDQPNPTPGNSVLSLHVGRDISMVNVLRGHQLPQNRHPFLAVDLQDSRAGSIGHLPLDPTFVERETRGASGPGRKLDLQRICTCGQRGHLNAVLGLSAFAERLDLEDELFFLARRLATAPPDATDIEFALNETGRLLAAVLLSPVAFLAPRAISLSGPMALPSLARGFQDRIRQEPVAIDPPLIQIPESSDRFGYSAARGAGLAFLRQHLYRPFFDNPDALWDGARSARDWSGWSSPGPPLEVEARSFAR